MPMSSHSRQSTPSNERVESRQLPEEWQLQILLEQHKKQPRPTVEQRRLLATQTGLDIKWITRWFKRMNSTSKSKHQSKVGSALSESQTGTAATTANGIDGGFDSVNSAAAVNNLAEPASSVESPDPSLLSSGDAMGDAFLFSPSRGSGATISDGVRSLVTSLHHTDAEHPPVSPSDLQANRESPIFYLHPQGPHVVFPSSHLPASVDPAARFQRPPPIGTAVATPDSYLTLPSSSFRHHDGHGDAASPSSATAHVAAQSVSSRGPHTSFPAGAGLLQTRRSHLNFVSEALAMAPVFTDPGHPLHGLGPTAPAPAVAAALHNHTHSTVGPSVGPDLDTPPLGPSTTPIPSMYWLLFDMDCDTIDRTRDGDVSSLSPPKLPSGDDANVSTGVTATTLPVTPTPISFVAKWEDMLALERRIRSSSSSSSHDKNNQNAEADLSPPLSEQLEYPEAQAQAQAQTQTQTQTRSHAQDPAVEINRTELDDRELLMRP